MGCICESNKNQNYNKTSDNTNENDKNEGNNKEIIPDNLSTQAIMNDIPIQNINNVNDKILDNPSVKKNNTRSNDISKIDKYTIDYSKLIGKGAFGQIYIGIEKDSLKEVAIKIEEQNNNSTFSYLMKESKIYSILKGYNHIPKIYDCFQNDNKNYLVMEILGSSLDFIFKMYNKHFSLSTVLNLGIQFIDIIEYIHSKNIIHRDLKPDCFLVGEKNKSKINLIDFGFAVNYIDPKIGLHYPLRTSAFVGNYKFTSNNSILYNYNKSRRDDIESIAYILIYFIKGCLPWENCQSKTEMQIARRQTSIAGLCNGVPEEIKTFLSYSLSLKFIEQPDYNHLRDLLNTCAMNRNIILTKNNYDWIISHNIELMESKTFVSINDRKFDTLSVTANSHVEENVRSVIESNYIKNKKSFELNKILRTEGIPGLNDEDYETFFALTKAIQNYQTEEDYLVHRYVDNNYLKSVFNFDPTNDLEYNLKVIKEQINSIKVEKGFMSCFMTDKHIIERNVKLEIKIPKGTNAYITQNKEESEIILGCNTEYQIMDAKIVNNIIQIGISILNNKKSFISFD